MDRPLDAGFRRARAMKRAAAWSGGLALAAAVFFWGPGWISPTISRARIRTATVDVGPIEAVIEASGTVVPEVEEVVSSPVDARVVRILAARRRGAEGRRAARRARRQRGALAVDGSRRTSRSSRTSRPGRASSWNEPQRPQQPGADQGAAAPGLPLAARTDRQLSSEGLLSEEQLKQSELAEAQAVIELKTDREPSATTPRVAAATLEGLALEMATLRKNEEAQPAARRWRPRGPTADGVLTWALTEEGVAIRKGDVIARIADLGSFRVDATVSDVHARRVRRGLPVHGQGRRRHARGHRPHRAADDPERRDDGAGRARGAVEPAPALEPARGRARRDRAARRARCASSAARSQQGEGPAAVFVVRGGRAVRTPVELGIAGFETSRWCPGLGRRRGHHLGHEDYLHLKEDPQSNARQVTASARTDDRLGRHREGLPHRAHRDGGALSDINLEIREGEFVSIMGPSGCGKSTLLNVIGPARRADRRHGPPQRRADRLVPGPALARMRNRQIGFIFQTFHLIADLSVVDNVEIPLLYRRMSAGERRAAGARGARTRRPRLARAPLSRRSSRAASSSASPSPAPSSATRASSSPTSRPATSTARWATRSWRSSRSSTRSEKTTVVMVTHDQRLAEQDGRIVRLFDGRQVNDGARRGARGCGVSAGSLSGSEH